MCAARPDSARCRAQRRDGTACQAKAGPSGYCIGHQPGAAEAHRKGGAATSTRAKAERLLPSFLRPVVDELLQAFREVHAGTLDPKAGAAMAGLARALIAALIAAFSAGMLEERLQAVEAAAERTRRERAADGQADDGMRRRGRRGHSGSEPVAQAGAGV